MAKKQPQRTTCSSKKKSQTGKRCDLHKQKPLGVARLECGKHEFCQQLYFPVKITAYAPQCVDIKKSKDKAKLHRHPGPVCEERWITCPATAKFSVDESFKEQMQGNVQFEVREPICEINKDRKRSPKDAQPPQIEAVKKRSKTSQPSKHTKKSTRTAQRSKPSRSRSRTRRSKHDRSKTTKRNKHRRR